MRKLSETNIVEKSLETLQGRARIKRTMWSRRAQEYEAKINSGDLVAISEVVRDLAEFKARSDVIVSNRRAEALADVPMKSPRIPVISNVDALPHDDPEEMRKILVRQILQPVRWEDSMRYLLAQGFDQFYEVGPGRVLRGLLRRIDRSASCQCVEV